MLLNRGALKTHCKYFPVGPAFAVMRMPVLNEKLFSSGLLVMGSI